MAALLLAIEAVASVYAFSRRDCREMSLRELRWWFKAASMRRAANQLSLFRAVKGV